MIFAALLAAALLHVRETPVKPVIDGWAEPAVWSRAEPVLLQDASCRALWDREALYLYFDGPPSVEVILNTSNVRSERLTHLDRRYKVNRTELRGTAMAGVEHGYADQPGGHRLELKLPWSTIGGINGQVTARVGNWLGELRLLTSRGTTVPVWTPAPAAARRGTVFFSDDFGPASRGDLMRNILPDSHYASGYRPLKWVQIDENPWDDPRRGFWIIDSKLDVLVQAGRSEPSWLFIGEPLPRRAANYDIEFLQSRSGHAPISFIFGASRPDARHDGIEFSYETRVPDSTRATTNLYYRGALGQGVVVDQAFTGHWVPHRIEVRGRRVRWLQADRVMAEADVPALRPGGFVGFCHRGERDTQYDDFTIRVIGRGQ